MDLPHQSRLIPGVKEGGDSEGLVVTEDGPKLPYDVIQPAPRLSAAIQHAALFFLTLTLLALSVYLAFLLWKKHRFRPIATLYKLEGYQYSRLNQNELEVDSVVFYSDALEENPTLPNPQTEVDLCKPATLHLTESDNLISMSTSSSCSSHFISNSSLQGGRSGPTILSMDTEMSDEDLLQ